MLWSSTGILFDIDRTAIEVVLLKCCRTSIFLQISPATAINNSNFRERIAVRALTLCSVFAELEDFCSIHVFQQPLRCFTEPVDLLRLAHIFEKLFLVLM